MLNVIFNRVSDEQFVNSSSASLKDFNSQWLFYWFLIMYIVVCYTSSHEETRRRWPVFSSRWLSRIMSLASDCVPWPFTISDTLRYTRIIIAIDFENVVIDGRRTDILTSTLKVKQFRQFRSINQCIRYKLQANTFDITPQSIRLYLYQLLYNVFLLYNIMYTRISYVISTQTISVANLKSK